MAHSLGKLHIHPVCHQKHYSEAANNIKIAVTIAILLLSGGGCQMLGANEHHVYSKLVWVGTDDVSVVLLSERKEPCE